MHQRGARHFKRTRDKLLIKVSRATWRGVRIALKPSRGPCFAPAVALLRATCAASALPPLLVRQLVAQPPPQLRPHRRLRLQQSLLACTAA